MENRLDLYTDYLITTVSQATATGLSNVLNGAVSHDQITRLLSGNTFSSRHLWQTIKPVVRAHESSDACLIFDDMIIEKQYSGEKSTYLLAF